MEEVPFELGCALEAGGSRRGREVCRAGIPDREWPKAETGHCGTWVENTESHFWTVCWVKFEKGRWCPNLQCLLKESGLNSESSKEPLLGFEKEREINRAGLEEVQLFLVVFASGLSLL